MSGNALATAWINGHIGDDGELQTVQATPAVSTIKRQNSVKQITNLAKKLKCPIDQVVTDILSASGDQLSQYVLYNGETPETDPTGLAVQATLIRAQTVGLIAKICNVPDDTALQILEQHEQDAIDTQSYDINKKLSPDVQGALAITMNAAASMVQSVGGSGNMATIMPDLQNAVGGYSTAMNQIKAAQLTSSNGYRGRRNGIDDTDAIGIDDPTDFPTLDSVEADTAISNTDFEVPALIPISTTLQPVGVTDPVSPTVTAPALSNASNLPQVTNASVATAQYGATAGGVVNALTTIGNVISGVSKLAGTVTSSANTVSNAINNAGAGSLQVWIQQHTGEFIAIIVFIGLVIYAATRRGGGGGAGGITVTA